MDDNNLEGRKSLALFSVLELSTSNNQNDTSNGNEIVEDDDLMEILNPIFRNYKRNFLIRNFKGHFY